MLAYSIHYLLAYFDDLSGQRQTVVSLHELRNQRVAVLVSLLDCSLFVDFRGTVGRVDLAAHIDRQGYLPSDESRLRSCNVRNQSAPMTGVRSC